MRSPFDRSPNDPTFDPLVLDRTVIALPLLKQMADERSALATARRVAEESGQEFEEEPPKVYHVIIELNLRHKVRREELRQRVRDMVREVMRGDTRMRLGGRPRGTSPYVYAELTAAAIQELADWTQREEPTVGDSDTKVVADAQGAGQDNIVSRTIHHIWPDFEVRAQMNKTIATVKADAAQKAFAAYGDGIVWAVMDSGIDSSHCHFTKWQNLDLDASRPLRHRSFLGLPPLASGADRTEDEEDKALEEDALTDGFGHGTHVAGIIAGETVAPDPKNPKDDSPTLAVLSRRRTEVNAIEYELVKGIERMSGMAPQAKLLSLKVLDDKGSGRTSSLIEAIEYVQELNGYGRELLIHGVNLSVGYDFEPEWFACGQSPLCVEVNRLVKSGVVVVVAAGNTGYGYANTEARGSVAAGIGLTINDPGNAEYAITVGSTHRDMPHRYGVSYFSSKGPTGDGRLKPDLVAPGEKILSCAAGGKLAKAKKKVLEIVPPATDLDASSAPAADGDFGLTGECTYFVEESGTSMAAPHVSGVIAAFLSIRPEFKGQAERVKEIFVDSAIDLRRERTFQGAGLVDLMRAIQSV